MKFLKAVSRLSDLAIIVSMIALVAIMLLVTADVVLRNLLSNSIPGAVEVSELLQGVVVFLGMAATLKSGHHITADFVMERLSAKSQAMTDLITGTLSLLVMGLMTYALWSVATGLGTAHEMTSLLGIPTQPFWFIAVFGVALMCIEILRIVIACIAVLRQSASIDGGSA